ncbi:related to HST1-silencing protein [Ustilago bromivora]|uniref:Related to HST1 - silencing protein n=1 Tax=Ustilago bromivora TaxID=307758 RepID=A0A1K0GZ99_9BASI|nr:related to HST1-silencing protein [Ustilago bromivora]SYW74753.1 related to HST1 - silencing protein [Ustilago bromivora]
MASNGAQQPTVSAANTSVDGGEASSSKLAPAMKAGEGSAAPPQLSAAPPNDVSYQSMDSEELSALEEMAEGESDSDTEIGRLLDEAAEAFPPEVVSLMVKDLKQNGIVIFLQRYVVPDPSSIRIKHLLLALGVFLPRSIRESDTPFEILLPILKTALARILRQREKLPQYNTIDDALTLLQRSKRIVVLSGAGISVSCGIPDFRSKDGIYSQLQSEGKYELDDPQDMLDKQYFLSNPEMFYSFAHRIFPSNFVPSSAHRFIKLIEGRGQLLRNYSQNIDTLEQLAGIEKVLQCHGSFATASCTNPECGYKCKGSQIAKAIFSQTVPVCPACEESKAREGSSSKKPIKKKRKLGNGKSWRPSNDSDDEDDEDNETQLAGFGVLKPDITFFGEKLSDAFDQALLADREEVDLLIVMGTSLKVAPVSEILGHIPHSTPVVLINKTPVLHMATDIMLLGDCDRIVEYLCRKLGWDLLLIQPNEDVVGTPATEEAKGKMALQDGREARAEALAPSNVKNESQEPERLMNSHAWLFEGAEPGRLPALLAEMEADDEEEESDGGGDDENQQDDQDDEPQQTKAELPIA